MINRRSFFKSITKALCGVALAAHFEFGQLVPVSVFAETPAITFEWVKNEILKFRKRFGQYPARMYLTDNEWATLMAPEAPWIEYTADGFGQTGFQEVKPRDSWMQVPGLNVNPLVKYEADKHQIWIGDSDEVDGAYLPDEPETQYSPVFSPNQYTMGSVPHQVRLQTGSDKRFSLE